ncbi:MAG: hypothetical protein VXZ72_03490 [Chlamydiota bacterium]|nr:hypothetical protein [Chlamydiota bacterium]
MSLSYLSYLNPSQLFHSKVYSMQPKEGEYGKLVLRGGVHILVNFVAIGALGILAKSLWRGTLPNMDVIIKRLKSLDPIVIKLVLISCGLTQDVWNGFKKMVDKFFDPQPRM